MIVSWCDSGEWDRDNPADRYQAAHEAQARLDRLLYGGHAPPGFRRVVDPACPAHDFGMVDGLCGVCVLEADSQGSAAA